MQIEDWRQINFLSEQAKLCHIRDLLLVRFFSVEVPIQKIRCNFADLTFVRMVFLHSDTANQAQLLINRWTVLWFKAIYFGYEVLLLYVDSRIFLCFHGKLL